MTRKSRTLEKIALRACKGLFFLPVFLLLACSAALPVHAQFIGYTSPQTVQQTLAAAGTACTGSAQTYTVQNLGQTQHYVYFVSPGNITNATIQMFGIDTNGNQYLISDVATISNAGLGANPILTASGYFPKVQVVVTCLPSATGTYTLNYSGSSATTNVNAGGFQLTQQSKVISQGLAANATFNSLLFPSPFGSSLGVLNFKYGATAVAGASLQVVCAIEAFSAVPQSFTYAIPLTTTAVQQFIVPDSACPNVQVIYTTGGATAATYSLEYTFEQPPFKLTNAYTHITNTTATIVKQGPGVVHSVAIGTPAAGTVSLFDLVPGSCTGTPASNTVAVITATATFPSAPMIYDTLFVNGICVKASATMDITISSQ